MQVIGFYHYDGKFSYVILNHKGKIINFGFLDWDNLKNLYKTLHKIKVHKAIIEEFLKVKTKQSFELWGAIKYILNLFKIEILEINQQTLKKIFSNINDFDKKKILKDAQFRKLKNYNLQEAYIVGYLGLKGELVKL